MNVSDQLKKIRFFLADNGFVTILEEMPGTGMTTVRGHFRTSAERHSRKAPPTSTGENRITREVKRLSHQHRIWWLGGRAFEDLGKGLAQPCGFGVQPAASLCGIPVEQVLDDQIEILSRDPRNVV